MTDRILIADDDPDIVRFVEVNLSIEGFDLIKASDGEEAVNAALEHAPDLVLLDVMMPKLDGFEVCRRIREDPRTSNTSIIMLTAKSLSADKVLGLASGADDYILKPFDPIELVARVKSTLRRAREMRDVNPLTGLPGNLAIRDEIQRRITLEGNFALMHVDLDNFKAFNDLYGFARGDVAIKLTARILKETAREHEGSFIGHIGGDDFAVICEADAAEPIANDIIEAFDTQVNELYDPAERQAGAIRVKDRRGEEQTYPLMSISIGISTTATRSFASHLEVSAIAAELKQHAKSRDGSAYSIDRRKGA